MHIQIKTRTDRQGKTDEDRRTRTYTQKEIDKTKEETGVFSGCECYEEAAFSRVRLEAGGKPSTWFPPGRLVELINFNDEKKIHPNSDSPQDFLPRNGLGSPEAQFFVTSQAFIMNEFFIKNITLI